MLQLIVSFECLSNYYHGIGVGKRHFIMFPLSFFEYVQATRAKYLKKIVNKGVFSQTQLQLYKNDIQKDFLDYCNIANRESCRQYLNMLTKLKIIKKVSTGLYESYSN